MPTRKKPLRKLLPPPFPADHFTLEQAHAAVLAVMAERGETPRPDLTATWIPGRRKRGSGETPPRCTA
ncbi:MAG TPA: hypothetical protein VEX86_03635 [Longimicrobium sp.]|nr:hypothetical protein [Longimicrobium sp.]